jgi:hypothetical protein
MGEELTQSSSPSRRRVSQKRPRIMLDQGGTPKIPRSIAAAYLLANSVKKVAWLSSLLNQPTAQLPD